MGGRRMKRLFFMYQRAMWYCSQFGAEIGKPMRFFSEFGMLILLCASYGIKLTFPQMTVTYFGVILFAIGGGWILTKVGVVAYNTQLANHQNEDLQEIKKSVKALELNAMSEEVRKIGEALARKSDEDFINRNGLWLKLHKKRRSLPLQYSGKKFTNRPVDTKTKNRRDTKNFHKKQR
jgi:hypothetical protein